MWLPETPLDLSGVVLYRLKVDFGAVANAFTAPRSFWSVAELSLPEWA